MKTLEMSELECYIGHIFAGALFYADDLKLLSPTKQGLQKLIDICKEFGIEFDVNYNQKKTIRNCKCVDKVKHLGGTVHFNLVGDDEIRRKKGDFIGITNSLHAQYGKLSSDVQSRLFNTYFNTSMGQRLGM